MTIAVTGATGKLGRLIIAGLKNKVAAEQIVGVVRNASKAKDLGVYVREADYTEPAKLLEAFQGVDTVMLISGTDMGQRIAQHHNVIEAAKAAGVKHIVYTSLLHAESSPLSLAAEHRATEVELQASEIPFTILRNGWYLENQTASIPGALAGGAFIGSAGDGQFSAAARADYAEAAVIVLTQAGHEEKIYELAGDEAYTLTNLAAEISRQTDRSIPYKNLAEKDFAKALLGLGLPEMFANALAEWDVKASQNALYDNGKQLSKLIGHPTTTLATAVAAVLQPVAKS